MEIPANFQSSLRLLFDRLLSDRPRHDQIFGYAENFFLNERTEDPKISHALHSLRYNLHNTSEFTMHVAEIFDILLTKQQGTSTSSSSSLQVVPVSEAVKLVAVLLQKPSNMLLPPSSSSSSSSSSSRSVMGGIPSSSNLNGANMGNGNGYTLTIFENMVINDVKNTLEFREFESLLRLSFILVEIDEWLNEILPHISFDSNSRKVQVSNSYRDLRTVNYPSTTIRTLNDEMTLQDRLLSLFENDVLSFEEVCKCREESCSNGALTLILSELFRGYLKEGEANDDALCNVH